MGKYVHARLGHRMFSLCVICGMGFWLIQAAPRVGQSANPGAIASKKSALSLKMPGKSQPLAAKPIPPVNKFDRLRVEFPVYPAADGVVWHGDLAKKEIALTFDDGPKPEYTEKLLAILRQYDVKATFFVVGVKTLLYPEIVRQIVAEGHSVGNHTFHHPMLANLPNADMTMEIIEGGNAIKAVTGKTPRFFRPPGGGFDQRVYQSEIAAGYTMVMWNVNPRDCACEDAVVLQERILSHAGNGSIVLMHVGKQTTMDALPGVITTLRAQGYRFVTLDEMFANGHEK